MDKRYPNFDLLRLLLALEVTIAHAGYIAVESYEWAGLVMAVPAFLAISGFLVLKSYEESGAWTVFIRKRALRLLPALILSFLLCLALFDKIVVYNTILIWITGGLYTPLGPANAPVWSLAWEELAYLLLALLWVAGAYRRPIVIWLLLIGSLAIVDAGKSLHPSRQIILFLMPAFFIGNLSYLYRAALLKINPTIPWAFLIMVIFSSHIPYLHQLINLSPVSFQAFAVVWAGIAGMRLVPFRFPDISYGMYIYHWPIALYLRRSGIASTSQEIALWLPIPLLAFCLVSWYLFEKPALSLKRSSGTITD
jgi:peptidoglycan/LPS O-acetylase OafA/YrhL